ncbi:hypothetical protein QOT17_000022 [Balamuthia mandrillaris]
MDATPPEFTLAREGAPMGPTPADKQGRAGPHRPEQFRQPSETMAGAPNTQHDPHVCMSDTEASFWDSILGDVETIEGLSETFSESLQEQQKIREQPEECPLPLPLPLEVVPLPHQHHHHRHQSRARSLPLSAEKPRTGGEAAHPFYSSSNSSFSSVSSSPLPSVRSPEAVAVADRIEAAAEEMKRKRGRKRGREEATSMEDGMPTGTMTTAGSKEHALQIVTKLLHEPLKLEDALEALEEYEDLHHEEGRTVLQKYHELKARVQEKTMWNLWRHDTHLGFFEELLQMLKFYFTNWMALPLPPVALLPEAIQYSLLHEEEDGCVDHLLMKASLRLALGFAFLLLDEKRQHVEEAFSHVYQARTYLGHLFDHTDYNVALNLHALAFLSILLIRDTERASYYLTLCVRICDTLQFSNSNAFYGSVYCQMVHFPCPEEQLYNIMDHVSKAQEGRQRLIIIPEDLVKGNPIMPEYVFDKRQQLGVTMCLRILTKILLALRVLKLKEHLCPAMMAPIFDTISRLNELSDDPHLRPVELMIKAFVCAASAHCNFLLQQRAEAVAWGNQFLQLTRKKAYKFVIFTAKPTIEWVLEVFYCCGHESLLLSLLHSVHMDATRFMVVRQARDYYEKLLGKRRNIAPVESEEEEERIQREVEGAGILCWQKQHVHYLLNEGTWYYTKATREDQRKIGDINHDDMEDFQ